MITCRENSLNEKEKTDIWDILCATDQEFIPPLSSRESTTQSNLLAVKSTSTPKTYFEELLKQSFLLAEEEEVQGFLSYRTNHIIKELSDLSCTYISTVIVSPKYRGQGITAELYNKLIALTDNCLVTRTWSSNHAHLHILKKLGFVEVLCLKDDRGPGIDTVYYCLRR